MQRGVQASVTAPTGHLGADVLVGELARGLAMAPCRPALGQGGLSDQEAERGHAPAVAAGQAEALLGSM